MEALTTCTMKHFLHESDLTLVTLATRLLNEQDVCNAARVLNVAALL